MMLVDYAHERWAAGRTVSPELWRCVGPFASKTDVADLIKVLREGSDLEQKAAALALAECPLPTAQTALSAAPELAAAIKHRAPNKPVILLTAFPPAYHVPAIDLVITKPFYLSTLREAVEKVMSKLRAK